MTEQTSIRIGARGSSLSLRQVDLVADLLRAAHPGLSVEVTVIATKGDRIADAPLPSIGGKGLFTEEIEFALLEGRIDLAVHSLKDLPTTEADGIMIGAVPTRASASDVLIARTGLRLADLPHGARIGTSSTRRASQLKRFRADFEPASIRGNVETRIRKSNDPANGYDAIVLAAAGIERLGLGDRVIDVLPFDVMLPAPGQGALAVQCRRDEQIERLLAAIGDPQTTFAVTAERAFLEGLGGGCSAPIAALGVFSDRQLLLSGRVLTDDGSQSLDVAMREECVNVDQARQLGAKLAEMAIEHGLPMPLERAW